MKKLFYILLFVPIILFGQHTFSIVAIDSVTHEIGSAGATCGDSQTWPGTPGAALISDIVPGQGAIHTQSFWNSINQSNANQLLFEGLQADEIINWLIDNDSENNPSIRQYGAVTLINNNIVADSYTGTNCFDYKNHIIGDNYAIQGNILLGQSVLDSMESRFLNTTGTLSQRLMASLLGAKVIGADTRCIEDQVSSLSAFLRVANENDNIDDLYIDIVVESTPNFIDPIDKVQQEFTLLINNLNIPEIKNAQSKLTKMIDVFGREHSVHNHGTLLFYIYEDGKVLKKIIN